MIQQIYKHSRVCAETALSLFQMSWKIIYDQAFWAGYEFMHAEHCITSCNHKLQLDLLLRCMATSDLETSTSCRHYSELETVWMLIQMLLSWLVGVYLWISEVKKSHISSSISAISLSLESSQLFKTEHNCTWTC